MKTTDGIHGSFEADPLTRDVVCCRGFGHKCAQAVVRDHEHEQFPFDHLGAATAQSLHAHCCFEDRAGTDRAGTG
jgi:hypothetical protein